MPDDCGRDSKLKFSLINAVCSDHTQITRFERLLILSRTGLYDASREYESTDANR
jgi:hypothetical protein